MIQVATIKTILSDIDDKLVNRFANYHSKNPHILDEFIVNAREMLNSGRTKYSAWAVINKIRWDHDIKVQGTDYFKISNDYIALFSRVAMQLNPELEGFFDIREILRKKVS